MSKTLYTTFNINEIENLYINKQIPLSKIALKFGVSHKTMKKFFILNGIDIHGKISSNKFLRDTNWLSEQYLQGKGLQKIANLANSTRGNVYYALKKANIPLRKNNSGNLLYKRVQIGETAGNYRGGRRESGVNGRYFSVLSHGHPHRDQDGYVMEHRLVMEKELGRYLKKDEIIHHLDGDGHNNNISNLKLTTRKKHFQDHFDAVKRVEYLEKLLKDNNISF